VSTLDPREAALLVIDMQRGFCASDSHMGRAVGTAAQQAIIPGITRMAERCRAAGIPVIWSRQIHYPEDVTRARRRLRSHADRQKFLPCLRDSGETEFADGISPEPPDHVVEKHRASVFFETNLAVKLRMLGTQILMIAGCNTEFCVESTVREAYARDLDVIVVRDCVAGIDPRCHQASLDVMGAYFAEVVDGARALEMFGVG